MAEEKEPTIQAAAGESGNNQPLVCQPILLESNQNHATIQTDGVSTTLPASMGMGGGYVPMVCKEESYCIGNGQVHDALCPSKEVSKTLNCMEDPMKIVTYALDRAMFNQGKNAAYKPSIEKEVSQTLVSRGPGAVCARDYKGIGNEYVSEDKCIVEPYQKAVGSLCARDYKGSVVRRLTPLECERLQGFPVVREVRFTEMTKDEYIAYNINEGHIIVDTENGKVYATRGPGGIKLSEPKELKGTLLNDYLIVQIRNGETKLQCRIHRVVWIAAHGIIPEGYIIDHINNDKTDNRLCNLQLLTPGENSTKAKEDGLYLIHDENPAAKITNEVHDLIQYVYGNSELSLRDLSDIFGISKSRVGQIIYEEPWTDIGDWIDSKGKKHKGDSDAPRYKALGNSIALPFWQYLAEKMCKYICNPKMASLFDGIGGFPLVYSRCGCEPVWASEIEEFPIAVTKIRFGEE